VKMPQPAYLTPIGGSRSQPEEPAFSVAAAATNWFNDTPTVAANSAAAFFTDVGSFNGWVFLLISSISGAVELLCLRAIHELLGQSQQVEASVSLGILVLQSPRPELI
jgi:hypothetical protein